MLESLLNAELSPPWSLLPAVHGEAGGPGMVGLVEKILEAATRAAESGGSFQLFPGIQALGLNAHPMIVHFPIALLSIFLLLDLSGWIFRRRKLREYAAIFLYFGALGAVMAAAAGLFASSFVPHGQSVHDIMEWHERLGLTVAILATILSVWRYLGKSALEGMAQALYLFLSVIMMTCLIFGADLGGYMVYHHGVAVHNLQIPDPHHHASSPGNEAR